MKLSDNQQAAMDGLNDLVRTHRVDFVSTKAWRAAVEGHMFRTKELVENGLVREVKLFTGGRTSLAYAPIEEVAR